MLNRKWLRMSVCVLTVTATAGLLAACGGGSDSPPSSSPTPVTYTIGATVSGLSGTVVLQNNGANTLAIMSNGTFTFSNGVVSGSAYVVSVSTQPTAQNCTVANGSGVAAANVTNITVACVNSSNWDELLWDQGQWK